MENQRLITLPPCNRKMTNVSATIKLAGKVAETLGSGNEAASEVVIQPQQVTIDELLVCIVKLEARVIVIEGGLTSASHVTSLLQEQLTAQTDELEIYSRKCRIVLTVLCKEENENSNKLKEDVAVTLCKTGISKKEIANDINKLKRIGKATKIKRRTLS